jgi:hypothetical protein
MIIHAHLVKYNFPGKNRLTIPLAVIMFCNRNESYLYNSKDQISQIVKYLEICFKILTYTGNLVLEKHIIINSNDYKHRFRSSKFIKSCNYRSKDNIN